MKTLFAVAAATLALTGPVLAEGDAAKGEKTFKKCKSCHMIVSPEGETIVKGGKTGPNLYGVIGRVAGSTDFKYGKDLVAAGEGGLVWDAESLTSYAKDPKGYLKEVTGNSKAKSKMTFKLKKGGEDVAAYLASVAPAPAATEEAETPAAE
ncbi:c-type cytochrome [Shimia litoralis]|uniref:C-type cytochrome n=1 Tax=Shimia litoralis TaxID=420403 RepID=A0A4U7N5G9_9RHOB|nr:c-type cytochrome [Shimia litoralis]TKZ20556.1 c-type cytochrome [Shimia litoralis]